MDTFLAVDPSTRATGWALFVVGRLNACGLIRASDSLEMIAAVGRELPAGFTGIIELPQIYRQRQQKGDPNDLIHVAAVAGACAAKCKASRFILPRTWKGTVPKSIDNARTLKALTAQESAVLQGVEIPAFLVDNVLDAIGLGLWETKRK